MWSGRVYVCVWASPVDVRCCSALWDYVHKRAAPLRQSCNCSIKNHSFIHSLSYISTVYWMKEWSLPIPVLFFFFFKLFTVGLSRGPIRNCGQVPGKQDPSTLKSLFASLLFTPVLSQEFLLKVFGKHWWKKKTLREEKQQVVLEPPTPHLLWYYLLLLSTDYVRWYDFYSLVWWSLWLFLLFFCCFFFVCGALRYETARGGGGKSSPMCI